ncbi:unnamed protein product [Calypogeia fissa]
MFTARALRHGPSATLVTDKTCHPRKLTRSLSQRMSLPGGSQLQGFDHGRPFATLEYQSTRKSSAESDVVQGQRYTTGSFETSALNLAQPEGATKQSDLAIANGPTVSDSSLWNENRTKYLQALAGLRQASVIGDGKVFRQTFVIRSYEVGSDGKASMDTIVSLFVEVAINHFSLLGLGGEGFGATPKMRLYRLIWVITKLHVEVERYPTWPEAICVDSWTDSAGKNGMMIDWVVREHATGEIIARGTSTWAMMNQDTRKLSKLPDDVREEIQDTFVTDKRRAIGDVTFERIPKLDNTAKNITSNLRATKSDLDGNNHVNNVTYIRWIMESVPKKAWDSHELSSMTLEYRRECKEADVAESFTDLEQLDDHCVPHSDAIGSPPSTGSPPLQNPPANGNVHVMASSSNGKGPSSVKNNVEMAPCCSDDSLHFIHLLRMQAKGEEVVRARTVWQQRT